MNRAQHVVEKQCRVVFLSLVLAASSSGAAQREAHSVNLEFSRNADVCVLEISSHWASLALWRRARLYGDGRLEIAEFADRDLDHATKTFQWSLSEVAFEEVRMEIEESRLHLFDDEAASTRVKSLDRVPPYVSEVAPTSIRLTWRDATSKRDREQISKLTLTYGGLESRLYPEIAEFEAANKLIIRVLSVTEQECTWCGG